MMLDTLCGLATEKCHCGKTAIAWYEFVTQYSFRGYIMSVCEDHDKYDRSAWRLLSPEEAIIKIVMDV